MLVLGPVRDVQEIALRPLETLAVDHRRSLAAEDVVDDLAVVAVSPAFEAGWQELDLTGDRRQRRAATQRILVRQCIAVEWVGSRLGLLERGECRFGLTPGIAERRRLLAGLCGAGSNVPEYAVPVAHAIGP